MAELTISIRGVDRLMAKLGKVQGTQVLLPPTQRAVFRLQRYMAVYPAQRNPKTLYVRGRGWADKDGRVRRFTSEHLGKRWTTKVESFGDGVQGKVGNNASYGPLVQSKKFQAAVHKNWWQTDADAIRDNRKDIVQDFNTSIKAALK
jgi:hypothetical protein